MAIGRRVDRSRGGSFYEKLFVKAYHAIRMHGSQFSPCSARQRHWKIGSLLIAYFAETCRRADARR
jgi:hypothetical protein